MSDISSINGCQRGCNAVKTALLSVFWGFISMEYGKVPKKDKMPKI